VDAPHPVVVSLDIFTAATGAVRRRHVAHVCTYEEGALP
jgi:hypothetical protein